MRSLFIGVCNNSKNDCEQVLQYLRNIEALLKIPFEIRIFHTGTELLHSYRPAFDAVILDIDLPDMPGERVVRSLREMDEHVHLILTSENEDVFSIGYRYRANSCWTKPLWYNIILTEFKKHLTYEILINRPYILLSGNTGVRKIYCHKLRYIETGNRQLIFHYDGEQISHYGKLADFEKHLPNDSFFRCNNSYIVNTNYVENITQDAFRYKIQLITGEEIPLSRDKKGMLVDMMKAGVRL